MSLKDRLKKQQKDLKNRAAGYKFFAIKEGTTRMRILPVGEEKDWGIEATVFYLGKEVGYVVSPITFGGKCAIMKGYNELNDSKKESDRAFAKKFRPNKKFFAPAIRYKDDKGKEVDMEAGVKPLMLSGGQYTELVDLYLDDDEAGDFTDKDNGYDIKFGRTGKTQTDTEYTVRACKPTLLVKPFRKSIYEPEEMLKLITPSYVETKEMLDKFLNLEPADDDEDEQPKKKKKKNRDL